jgi:uncharacterized protein
MAPVPRVRHLSEEECRAILGRNHVGRLAYARDERVDIEPLHYVQHGPWLYGRTAPGSKLETTGTRWWPVAFEVDEVEGAFQWRSVVVHGGFYVLHQEGAEWEREEHRRGVELLREVIPETLAPGDPFPQREVVFRIAAQELTGRACVPSME